MNSSPVRRRPSKAVYRRRRLAVLLALVLVIVGVVLAIVRPWESGASDKAGADASQSAKTPTSGSEPTVGMSTLPDSSKVPPAEEGVTPSSGATTGEVQPCTSDQITVTPATDKQTYAAGETPKLTVTLENVSQNDCTIDAGTAAQVFEVSSGDEVYWRSTDCQSDPSNQVVTLKAGQKVPSSAALVWDRTRSSADTCDSDSRPAAPAAGASYHLSVSVGGMKSATTAQFILN